MPNQLSNCCKAEMKVITDTDLGRAGTSYYECIKCGKPCDIYVAKTWQEELENLMVRVDGDLDAVDGLIGITNTQIRIHKINEFITDLRKQDEEELIKVLETDSAFIYSDLVIEKLKDYYKE